MMYLKSQRPLAIFLALVLLFAACKKDSDSAPAPVTEPITVAAAKPGDTIVIKGQNFSEVAANNTVKFNGIPGTLVSATTTELKVVVPGGQSSGTITVTVNGVTVEVGSLTISPLTIYAIKENYADINKTISQLVAIDPATGNELLLLALTDTPDLDIQYMKYMPATNEVIGVNNGKKLLKINVTTKQTSFVTLTNQPFEFTNLVTDKSGNLYAVKTDWTSPNEPSYSLVQIDFKTGNVTNLKAILPDYSLDELVFLPATNEIAGLDGGKRLFRMNLSTRDTASFRLTNIDSEYFNDLVTDNQSNIYAYIEDWTSFSNPKLRIARIDRVIGAQTLVTNVSGTTDLDELLFVSERNEFVGIWANTSLYRFNLSTKTSSVLPITSQQKINYFDLTSN